MALGLFGLKRLKGFHVSFKCARIAYQLQVMMSDDITLVWTISESPPSDSDSWTEMAWPHESSSTR
ncbi:hypothetical protein SO802_003893 [Lithocarpus litseifolius]|uniref:Uncharacterized protein n=1 Tax=Lithocarpus litseifolius TaxID=425828 RepID=A0AAW2E5A1_9ROSI